MTRSLLGLAFAAMLTITTFGCGQPTDDAPVSDAGTDATAVDGETEDHPDHAAIYCGHCGQEKGSEVCCKEDAEKCDCGMAKGAPLCCKELPEDAAGKDICSGCGHTVAEDAHHHCDEDCEKCEDCGLHAGAPACCKLK